jgi:predicted lipoprotein with Yx(FWY)xxD motif
MGLRVLKVRFAVIAVVTAVAVSATVADATLPTTVKSTNISALGKILVSASGRTLYHNAFEKKNIIKCTGSCASEWPPLVIAAGAKPVAGAGVTASLLGTLKRSDGKIQVTYSGKPLYRYSGDKKAGDVKGQGGGGIWHVLAPTGAVVTKAVTGSTTSSGSGSGSSSGSGSGGTTTTTTPTDCDLHPDGYGCM